MKRNKRSLPDSSGISADAYSNPPVGGFNLNLGAVASAVKTCARRIIGYEIHQPAAAGTTQCPSTQAVHRARTNAYRNQHADLLEQYRATRGRELPAVERIIQGDL